MAIFGVIWTIGAASIGAPGFFALFGVVFIAMAVLGAIYNFYNAAAPNRMSTLDVTHDGEESDPVADALGYSKRQAGGTQQTTGEANRPVRRLEGDFCPFCGAPVQSDFDFCPKCGKDI